MLAPPPGPANTTWSPRPRDATDFGSSTPLDGMCEVYFRRVSSVAFDAAKTSTSVTPGWALTNANASCAAFASSVAVTRDSRAWPGDVRALHGVAVLVPTGQPLVEDALVAPAEDVHDVAGPPGQGVGARSIEDDEAGLGNLLGAIAESSDRNRARALDVALAVLLPRPDVDDVGLLAAIEPELQLFDADVAHGSIGWRGGCGADQEQAGRDDDDERPAHVSSR